VSDELVVGVGEDQMANLMRECKTLPCIARSLAEVYGCTAGALFEPTVLDHVSLSDQTDSQLPRDGDEIDRRGWVKPG
jgi:hypothetical protein